jgi:hypothetical protein
MHPIESPVLARCMCEIHSDRMFREFHETEKRFQLERFGYDTDGATSNPDGRRRLVSKFTFVNFVATNVD